jgi:hypothetical protein
MLAARPGGAEDLAPDHPPRRAALRTVGRRTAVEVTSAQAGPGAGGLDLDHPGAEVPEHHPGVRAGQGG